MKRFCFHSFHAIESLVFEPAEVVDAEVVVATVVEEEDEEEEEEEEEEAEVAEAVVGAE